MCSSPIGWAKHKSKQYKGDRGISSVQSMGLYKLTDYLLPVGSCKYAISFLLENVSYLSSGTDLLQGENRE
jgi:hypothetical protein